MTHTDNTQFEKWAKTPHIAQPEKVTELDWTGDTGTSNASWPETVSEIEEYDGHDPEFVEHYLNKWTDTDEPQ